MPEEPAVLVRRVRDGDANERGAELDAEADELRPGMQNMMNVTQMQNMMKAIVTIEALATRGTGPEHDPVNVAADGDLPTSDEAPLEPDKSAPLLWPDSWGLLGPSLGWPEGSIWFADWLEPFATQLAGLVECPVATERVRPVTTLKLAVVVPVLQQRAVPVIVGRESGVSVLRFPPAPAGRREVAPRVSTPGRPHGGRVRAPARARNRRKLARRVSNRVRVRAATGDPAPGEPVHPRPRGGVPAALADAFRVAGDILQAERRVGFARSLARPRREARVP
jgi:hypothetical protein